MTVRIPALERLGRLWPDVARKVTGEAELTARASGAGFQDVDGRLRLRIPEAEALDGRVLARDVVADVPFRRGRGAAPAPPGDVEVSELLAYGVLVRDIRAAAHLAGDRLALDRLAYTLYDGAGGGAVEADLAAADGPRVVAHLSGERVRIEEFMSSYGVRGGTMTGLLRYDLQARSAGSGVALDGWLDVPQGGAVNIELLTRLLSYAGSDPTGVVKSALENLRNFEYKDARVDVRTPADGDPRLDLGLRGRERFGIFPPRVKEINVRSLPLSFLTRQLTGR